MFAEAIGHVPGKLSGNGFRVGLPVRAHRRMTLSRALR